MITRIHVNGHNLRANKKDGGSRPVFTAKSYRGNEKGNRVVIQGPSRLIYNPDRSPIKGAVAYIQTQSEVVVT